MTARPEVSLVIPAYNEARRIGPTLDAVLAWIGTRPERYELIVVDDGSEDGTLEVVWARLRGVGEVRVHRQVPNQGKGAAIRAGMERATGRFRVFFDADLAVPLGCLPGLLEALRAGADVAVGSRRAPGAVIEVHQPRAREALGRGYTWLARGLLGLGVRDVTCGFKGFRERAAGAIFSRLRVRSWSFDAEVLYLARRLGYRVVEVPVRWRNDGMTHVRLPRDLAGSLAGLLAIRLNACRGAYGR